MSKKNILIIGYGNVGKAIGKIEEEAGNNIYILERENGQEKIKYDVCHITIPYSIHYVKIVTDYLREYIPKLIIIHTTIIFDVLKDIKKVTGMKIVYAPINLPHNSNEEIVYQDKKEKPTHIIGYNIDIKYSKQHLEDILNNKVVYSISNRSCYSYKTVKSKIKKKIKFKYIMRSDELINAIQSKQNNPLKKVGKYY